MPAAKKRAGCVTPAVAHSPPRDCVERTLRAEPVQDRSHGHRAGSPLRRRRGGVPERWPVVVCWLLCAAATLSATAAGVLAEDEPSAVSGAGRVWTFFPEDDVYPQYIADPLRPQSAVILAGFPSSGIPDSGV